MTQLSRLTKLGIAPEPAPGSYTAPTSSIPFDKSDVEDVIASIRDESFRVNDSVLQGLYQGPANAVWSVDVMAYTDLLGLFLRGIIGPDVVTAGVSTQLAAPVAPGAASISTAATIPTGSTIMIDTGASVEYAVTGAPTGAGPYTIPIVTPAGLSLAHLAAATVVSQTTHTFKQNPLAPKTTYSFTVDDTTGSPQGYAYAVMSDMAIKIDPKAALSLSMKFTSMPGLPQATFVPTFSGAKPILGWQWAMVNAGASSSRGLTMDYTIKRAIDPIASSDGSQGPREIFQGPMEADFSYKAIYENQTDLNLFLQNLQQPATANLVQPLADGGASLAITLSKSGWNKGKRDWSTPYVEATFSGSGIYNATDGGVAAFVLKNFVPGVY